MGAGMTFAVVGVVAVPVAAAFVVWERVRGKRRSKGFDTELLQMRVVATTLLGLGALGSMLQQNAHPVEHNAAWTE